MTLHPEGQHAPGMSVDVTDVECGIDTFSTAWRIDLHGEALRQVRDGENPRIGSMRLRRTTGGGLISCEQIHGMRYGVRLGRENGKGGPSSLWMEGRAGAAEGTLSSISGVLSAIDRGTQHWRQIGCDPDGILIPKVRRLDLAADVRCEDPQSGAQLLADLAKVDLSRGQRKRVWHDFYAAGTYTSGMDLTRQLANSNPVDLRAYCKTTEQAAKLGGDRPSIPGTWVRIERQLRWAGSKQPELGTALRPEFMAKEWAKPIASMLRPLSTTSEAISRILSSYSNGELDGMTAQRLIGRLALLEHDPQLTTSRSTQVRTAALLRTVGIEQISAVQIASSSMQLLVDCAEAWRRIAAAPPLHELMLPAYPDDILI